MPSPGSGYWGVKQVGDRWVLSTPEGKGFWMRAVYVLDWTDGGTVSTETFKTKYGGDQLKFAEHSVARIRSWGFNTIGQFANLYTLPVPTYGRTWTNPQKLPFIRMLNVSWYGAIGQWNMAPFKTLLIGAVDPAIYTGWPGHLPDPFDPNFETAARTMAGETFDATQRAAVFTKGGAGGGLPHPSLVNEPWLIGTTPDDSDYVFGFGPGPEVPGLNGVIHPHVGWIVAVTRPTQTSNPSIGKAFGSTRTVSYSDPVVYAKVAWRNFIASRYGSVEALNKAWGSTYTSFDSHGGWPTGTGLMDENGRNAWIGRDYQRLATAAPQVKADLDAFLEIFADKYFKVVSDAVRAATPNHLIFSPMLNGHKALSRREILRAAGRHCHVVEVDQHPDKPELLGMTYGEARRPLYSWVGFKANADSAMSAYPQSGFQIATQAERGEYYKRTLEMIFSYRAADGAYPVIGMDWWEFMDKVGEKSNWGLVSPKHNAYDGVEAQVGIGKDAWGYPTGGEADNYGDFLSAVKAVHAQIDQLLAAY